MNYLQHNETFRKFKSALVQLINCGTTRDSNDCATLCLKSVASDLLLYCSWDDSIP